MNQYAIRRWVFVSAGGMFVLGFVSGSVSQRQPAPGAGGDGGSTRLGEGTRVIYCRDAAAC